MKVTLSQAGRSCILQASVDKYYAKGRDGMAELSRALAAGMTPVISYWSSRDMQWMDGVGRQGRGACLSDGDVCPESVRFSSFAVEELRGACEVCPVGGCDRAPDGACVWFAGRFLRGIEAFHCKVASCAEVPLGRSFSKCWSWKGTSYYSITDHGFPCKSEAAREAAREAAPAGQASPRAERAERSQGGAAQVARNASQQDILEGVHALLLPEAPSGSSYAEVTGTMVLVAVALGAAAALTVMVGCRSLWPLLQQGIPVTTLAEKEAPLKYQKVQPLAEPEPELTAGSCPHIGCGVLRF